jgi:AcrR family transcriptional regulator
MAMDRRRRKTREAIFSAFTELLSKKSFENITISEVIEQADVGRATFYAHFETKDFLLRELCSELFEHVLESAMGNSRAHSHIFDCEASDTVFLHLFKHFQKNDNGILKLISGSSGELFIKYFKADLIKLVKVNISLFDDKISKRLPQDYAINHIASTFLEALRYWTETGMTLTAEKINEYFFCAITGE